MNKAAKLLMYAFLAIFILGTHSCSKDKTTTTPNTTATQTSMATDDALAQKTYDDVQSIANEAMSSYSKLNVLDSVFLGNCATITLDLTVMPYKLTIDFGTTNCMCPDNKNRRGKIICTFNGAYSDSGTIIRDSLDNYYVDDNKVEGVRIVTNLGHNIAGHPHFSVLTTGTIIKANNGGTITWQHSGEREWVAGYDTFTWLDDEYLIYGSTSGTAANGQSYTLTIDTALDVKLNCKYITAGVLTFHAAGIPDVSLEYGDGTCDNVAVLTVSGVHITVYL
jgi:hypothetical protein